MSDKGIEKIDATLLNAVRADPDKMQADVMVQLESPEQVMNRSCASTNMDRSETTTCLVDNLQAFADALQKQVKDLLAQHHAEYSDATFFWINNSVSVKKARGTLILALAALDTVIQVHGEEIFHTMGTSEDVGTVKPMSFT